MQHDFQTKLWLFRTSSQGDFVFDQGLAQHTRARTDSVLLLHVFTTRSIEHPPFHSIPFLLALLAHLLTKTIYVPLHKPQQEQKDKKEEKGEEVNHISPVRSIQVRPTVLVFYFYFCHLFCYYFFSLEKENRKCYYSFRVGNICERLFGVIGTSCMTVHTYLPSYLTTYLPSALQ